MAPRVEKQLPAECQEFIQYDEKLAEKHIADVRTHHGLVIEFQHSHLDPQERAARERFYGNMVWVVDGTRLRRDYPRFLKGKESLRPTNNLPGYFLLAFPDECFPMMWLDSSVPVIFDFQGIGESQSSDVFRDTLWCLLPGRAERNAVVVGISREDFVKVAPSRPQLLPVSDIVTGFAQHIRELRAAENALEAQQRYRGFAGMPGGMVPRRRKSARF